MEEFNYKDPINNYDITFSLIDIDKLKVSKNQRKPSKELVERLISSIRKTGFVSALVCIKDNDNYIIVDGQHRYLAAKTMGIQKIPCIIIPKEYGLKLMEFNVEKAPNFREKSYVALNVYYDFLNQNPDMKETDTLILDSIELACYITAGIAYQSNPRFYGSAFSSLVKRVDSFLDMPLKEAIEVRKERAELLNQADQILKKATQKLKELNYNNPFLFQEVVSFCNPIGKKRKADISFENAINEFIKKANELIENPSLFNQS
ncbi:MAG: ParB/RepB/Spo0J family partition protein [Candidatus Parvarchaeota archaeon]|nr:ParB/RepB/Spo0J family partition protein [Candidatus Rehaiarchaeum fermentans]MCW1293460.1 ParB/RepB/Spo0J family partition protein [Candidatus Rehaiarchaeum fermentans]